MKDRSIVRLQCPGTRYLYTVIVSTPWQAKFGLGNPCNTGTCTLFIGALDDNDEPLEPRNNLQLKPGERRHWYYPPDGATKIIAVCTKECQGETILEYDTPNC